MAGLLLVGAVAEADGLFAWAGAGLARLPLGPRSLFVAALGVVAAVTAVLNLDTSVFFLTPVLVHLARARRVDEAPYLYGTVFMSNSASLFLPGSNLTNLIVLHHEHVSGSVFLLRMAPAATTAVVVTALVLLVAFRRELGAGAPVVEPASLRLGVGVTAIAASAALVLAARAPALPVLVVGALAAGARVGMRRAREAVDLRLLGLLFAAAVALGAIARVWRGPEALVGSIGPGPTAGLGAIAANVVNNLPASVLLAPEPPLHPRALLLGLDLGPNLAVAGSLSALLWLRVARSLGARPSARRYSAVGVVLVPLSLGGALLALGLVGGRL